MELDHEDLKTKLDKILAQRRERLGDRAEPADEGPPLFLQAAREEASRLGLSLEELLRQDAENLRESRYPGPDCLRPQEVEAYVASGELPAGRMAHVRGCPGCDALLAAAAVPPPFPIEPRVEKVRRREPEWQQRLASWVPAAPPRWATALAAAGLGVAAVLLGWLLVGGPQLSTSPQIFVDVSRSALTAESGWPGVACAEVVSSVLAGDREMAVVPWDLTARMAFSRGWRRPGGARSDTVVRCSGEASRDSAVRLQVSIEKGGTVRRETFPAAGEASRKATSVFDAAFAAGQWVRKEVGAEEVPERTKERYRYALPMNREALRLYSLGLAKLWRFQRPQEAIALLTGATSREPYPLAYHALSEAFSQLGDASRQRQNAEAALRSADHYELPEHERLVLEGKRWEAAANWRQAVLSYDQLERISPEPSEAVILAAEAHLATSDAKSALAKIEELRGKKLAPLQAARLALVEASAAEILSEPARQRDAALRAVKTSSVLGARSLEARGHLMAGKALRDLGDKDAAGQFDHAWRLFADADDVQGIADVLREQGVSAQLADDTAHAESLFQDALGGYRVFGDRGGVAKIEIDLGHLDADKKKISDARKHYRRALQIYRILGNEQGIARALTSQGILLWHEEGDFPAAIGFFGEALRLDEKISYRGGVAYVLANLGQLRLEQGLLREARVVLERCLAIREEIGFRRGEAIVHAALAEVLVYEDDLADAERHLESALAIAGSQLASPSLVAKIRLQRAEVWMEQGRFNEAEPEIRYVHDNFQPLQPAAAAALADLLLRLQRPEEAQMVLAKTDIPIDDSRLRCKVEILKSQTETATGKPAQAVARLQPLLEQIRAEDLVLFDLRARLTLAEAYQRMGREQLAQEQFQQVRDAASELGVLLFAHKAETLLGRGSRNLALSSFLSFPLTRSLRSLF